MASSVSPSSPLRTISSESRGVKKKGEQNTVEEARTSGYQEQGAQGQADRDGDRGEIAEEVDDGGGLGQDCQHHEDVNTINCIYEEDKDRKLTSCQFCLK